MTFTSKLRAFANATPEPPALADRLYTARDLIEAKVFPGSEGSLLKLEHLPASRKGTRWDAI